MMTYEQMVERMARAACNRFCGKLQWDDLTDREREQWRLDMEAALDASGLWPVYEAAVAVKEDWIEGSGMGRGIDRLDDALNAVENPNDPA